LYKVKYKGEDIKKIRVRARPHHVLADFEDAFAQDSDLSFFYFFLFSFDTQGVSWEKKYTMLVDFMKRECP